MFFKKKKKPIYKNNDFYSPLQRKGKHAQEVKWVKSILIPGSKISLYERIMKFLIYIALRMVIRPKKWINPEKNFKIIDYTYKKISSEDLAFIPSSIAFYLVMGFMPILTLIIFLFDIPEVNELFGDHALNVISGFVPGLGSIIEQMEQNSLSEISVALITTLVTSIWIASAGFAKLIYTQSYIFDFDKRGSFWGNRIKGILMVLALTFFLGLALGINIVLEKYVISLFPGVWAVVARWTILLLSLFFLVIFVFAVFFKVTPLYKVKFVNILPGAFVSGVPTFIFLALFGYITNLWSYGNYGVIGIIMYIGMASLVVTNFIFYGITANAAYNREFVEEALVSKRHKMPKAKKLNQPRRR